jgi:DNA-binding NtrC family response regulator
MTEGDDPAVHIWFYAQDEAFANIIARALGPGFAIRSMNRLDHATARDEADWCDVALLDLRWAETESNIAAAITLVDEINRLNLPPPVIGLLGENNKAAPRQLMEAGAYDTVESPPDMGELRLVLRRAFRLRKMEKELCRLNSQSNFAGHPSFLELLDSTEPMQQVASLARKVALCDVSVLVTGETGTGKELLSRAIHRLSPRSEGPFVAFSCANLPETLVEGELFGHEKGAFTGAVAMRRGRFEAADKGTLLLDEVGDLPLSLQAKLLRVLQERSFERLGSNTPLSVDFRLICATHRNLPEMVAQGLFREDLYYRLNVMQLHIPALRERRGGIPLLAQRFLERFAAQFGKKTKRFSRLALHVLGEYDWPGNVRQLENVVQRAVVMADGSTIEIWHLPLALRNGFDDTAAVVHSYEEEVRDFKRRLILRTLQECGWSKAKTARTLGVARGYLHRLINQLQITPAGFAAVPKPAETKPPLSRVM